MEQGPQIASSFHLAGIVPVAGQPFDFEFPWHDCLQPIGKNYLALERAILECAYAGCETIWVVCHKETQALVKHRLGDYIYDPVRYWSHWNKIPTDNQKIIPIFFVPIHPKDRGKRDCLSWSALYGALTAYWLNQKISRWVTPDRYYVSFPQGVYPPEFLKAHRKQISSKKPFFVSSAGKTVKDNQ